MSSSEKKSRSATALKYDPSKNSAPVVVASGSGYVADKIVEIAETNGVPVYRDESVASLLSLIETGNEIPENLFAAIVDIYLYFLNFNPFEQNNSSSKGE